jgi:coproporphyrinogen III oxidase
MLFLLAIYFLQCYKTSQNLTFNYSFMSISAEIDINNIVDWFTSLRNQICQEFEKIEHEASISNNLPAGQFERQDWQRLEGGGGCMAIMKGRVFEKVGVNVSTVHGHFSEQFRSEIPGTEASSEFWAAGISLVAHMRSPLVPAVHMNTRFIRTGKHWFGGGADLTPIFPDSCDTASFHSALKQACDLFDSSYYPKFTAECDRYFYLKHRQEPRGVGGIFYDYLNSGNFAQDFAFTKQIGLAFLDIYPKIIRKNMHTSWDAAMREQQLIKRGRYVEFNLLYDRGTKFGLMTGGNTEAILMSLPPEVKWV